MGDPGPPIEGTAVEMGQENAAEGGQGLARVPGGASVLEPLNVGEVKASMQQYQEGLHSLLDKSDWQDAGRGESFVKKSGWRKIATWFGLSVEVVRFRVDRDQEGQPTRASVVARAVAPNGRFMEGDGHCSVHESRFSRNKGKLENDLIGTATTRAKNRAIADLVGMGAVSAEETDAGAPAAPPFGPEADSKAADQLARALAVLVGEENVSGIIDHIRNDAGGYLPRLSARAVVHAAAVYVNNNPQEDPDGSSDSDTAGPEDAAGGEASEPGDEGADAEPAAVGADAEPDY